MFLFTQQEKFFAVLMNDEYEVRDLFSLWITIKIRFSEVISLVSMMFCLVVREAFSLSEKFHPFYFDWKLCCLTTKDFHLLTRPFLSQFHHKNDKSTEEIFHHLCHLDFLLLWQLCGDQCLHRWSLILFCGKAFFSFPCKKSLYLIQKRNQIKFTFFEFNNSFEWDKFLRSIYGFVLSRVKGKKQDDFKCKFPSLLFLKIPWGRSKKRGIISSFLFIHPQHWSILNNTQQARSAI